jgi:hypothetical protein
MAKNDQTTICIPPDTKKRVRIMAAEWNIPMGQAALRLIQVGLGEYKRLSIADPSYALPGPGPVMETGV